MATLVCEPETRDVTTIDLGRFSSSILPGPWTAIVTALTEEEGERIEEEREEEYEREAEEQREEREEMDREQEEERTEAAAEEYEEEERYYGEEEA